MEYNYQPDVAKQSKKRRIKSSSYCLTVSAIALAIVVIVNLLVSALPEKIMKYDISANDLYTISDQTKEIVQNIKSNINAYLITRSSQEDTIVYELLKKYESENSKIKVSVIDPVQNPTFTTNYTTDDVAENSIIFESSDTGRSKVVPYSDLYSVEYSEEEYMNYYYYGVTPTGTSYFNGEESITSALDYVSAESLPKVYYTTGHGEEDVSDMDLASDLGDENIELNELNIASEGIPDDCDVLMFAVPSIDITTDEVEVIEEYLENGGNLVLSTYFEYGELENLYGIMEKYGLNYETGLLCDGDASHYYNGQPYYLLPTIEDNDFSSLLTSSNINIVGYTSHAISLSDELEDGYSNESLLTTSSSAYIKDVENASTYEKENGDKSGQFSVGAVGYLTNDEDEITSQVVWYSTPYITQDIGGNENYFIASITKLCNKESSITIAAKPLDTENITINQAAISVWSALLIGVLPVGTIILGLVIWSSRRKK